MPHRPSGYKKFREMVRTLSSVPALRKKKDKSERLGVAAFCPSNGRKNGQTMYYL